jgi:hypothetical protein
MRNRLSALILINIAFVGCASAGPVVTPARNAAVDAAAATITAADVQRRIEFLSSDELRGRDTPSPGLEAAARYAADEFRALGLTPAGDSGTYIRRFPYDDTKLDNDRVLLETRAHGAASRARFGAEFFVIPSAVDSVVDSPLYAGVARGALLPREAGGRTLVFFVPDSLSPEWQQSVSGALQSALAARAAAVVLVLDTLFAERSIGQLSSELASQVLPLPVVGMAYAPARAMFAHAGVDLDAGRTSVTSGVTPLTGVTLAIRAPVAGGVVRAPNVVAVLTGSDPALRDEHIVFSAHFDHVGIGPAVAGDSIYNGADDNASGSSALLEIAKAFAALRSPPARSIMFVLVSAEEKGLLGSAAFVADPPVPVSRMVANINMDMIGRNAPDTVVAIGQDYSSLGPAVQRIVARHPELGLVVAHDLWPQEQLFFRSDHFSFAAKEVPAIFFTTGLHDDYHAPSDEAHTIDADKVARIARLLFRFAHELATSPARPEWTPEGLRQVRAQTGG